MAKELTSQVQIEDDGEAHAATLLQQNVGEVSIDGVAEIFNPLEAIEIVFDEPGAGFMAIAGLVAIVLITVGLWAMVQGFLVSGGPPQGLGLK